MVDVCEVTTSQCVREREDIETDGMGDITIGRSEWEMGDKVAWQLTEVWWCMVAVKYYIYNGLCVYRGSTIIKRTGAYT